MKKLMLLFLLSMGIATAKAVPFMLYNSGLSSIALEIPGVMNPNLSPLSVSGVGLGGRTKNILLSSRSKGDTLRS